MITMQNNIYKHCKLLFTIYICGGGWVFMYVCLRLEEKYVIKTFHSGMRTPKFLTLCMLFTVEFRVNHHLPQEEASLMTFE